MDKKRMETLSSEIIERLFEGPESDGLREAIKKAVARLDTDEGIYGLSIYETLGQDIWDLIEHAMESLEERDKREPKNDGSKYV